MTLVLDTTVLIDVLRGRSAGERVRGLARAGELLLTTAVNVEEVVRGLRPNEQQAADTLLAGLRVLPIRRPEAERAGPMAT
jgi:predicted nucleic acid-binding protein